MKFKKQEGSTDIQAWATFPPQKEAKWSSHMLSLFLPKRHRPLFSQYHAKRPLSETIQQHIKCTYWVNVYIMKLKRKKKLQVSLFWYTENRKERKKSKWTTKGFYAFYLMYNVRKRKQGLKEITLYLWNRNLTRK